jgi:hypothetical protein
VRVAETGLCETRPPEWWEVDNGGARLAVLLCHVCPSRVGCAERAAAGDRAGMIWAGVPYNDRCEPVRLCDCGYPRLIGRGTFTSCCRRCAVPKVPLPGSLDWLPDKARVEALRRHLRVGGSIKAFRIMHGLSGSVTSRLARLARQPEPAPPVRDPAA